MLEIELEGPFNSKQLKHVLSGTDVLTKYLFAVPLINGYGNTVTRELAKVLFQHNYIPQTVLSE